ncbi:MAG: carbonic anhydrase [Defluviitaleaceae bacterium]|nr:carbonic anhydrase [Defluviitaleaceae bacterium]
MSAKLHAPDEQIKDPQVALNFLKEGNERFVSGNTIPRDTNSEDIKITAGGQKPFAAILTCADSRVAPELYFDQKIGDIFIVRNAGNTADNVEALGSIEFATKHLGAPLVVVVGHSACGAVFTSHSKATGLSSNLQTVLDNIRINIENVATPEEAVAVNVKAQVETLKNNPVIKEINALVVGAEYDIATGKVTFLS